MAATMDQTGQRGPAPRRNRLAAAIALHDDRVLVVRRSETETFLPSHWSIPCGKIEKGERPEEAVLRELKEETGLDGEDVQFVGQTFFRSLWDGQPVENEQSNYLVRPREAGGDSRGRSPGDDGLPKVDLPAKDQAYKWVPMAEVENFGLDEHNLKTIRQGLDMLSEHEPVRSGTAGR
jgi:8-oxo-dGTP diphosphatase